MIKDTSDNCPREGWTTNTLKEFMGREMVKERELTRVLIEAMEKAHDRDIANSKESVVAALSASDKQTTAAFDSAEKAIEKAEQAQKEYNIRSNEFRQALDDSNKNNMSRTEYIQGHTSLIQKIEGVEKSVNLLSPKEIVDANLDRLRDDIKNLQLARATLDGKASQESVGRAQLIALIGMGFGLIGTVIAIINLFSKVTK